MAASPLGQVAVGSPACSASPCTVTSGCLYVFSELLYIPHLSIILTSK